MKILVEPQDALGANALLTKEVGLTGKNVGMILSGGNVALTDSRQGERISPLRLTTAMSSSHQCIHGLYDHTEEV